MNYRDSAWYISGIASGMLISVICLMGLMVVAGNEFADIINNVEVNNPSLVIDFNQTRLIEDMAEMREHYSTGFYGNLEYIINDTYNGTPIYLYGLLKETEDAEYRESGLLTQDRVSGDLQRGNPCYIDETRSHLVCWGRSE